MELSISGRALVEIGALEKSTLYYILVFGRTKLSFKFLYSVGVGGLSGFTTPFSVLENTYYSSFSFWSAMIVLSRSIVTSPMLVQSAFGL
jgi:hypothetical protein